MDEKVSVKPIAKQFRIKSEIHAGKGLGDWVSDFTHATGLNKLAEWYTDTTGNDCGCEKRREELNNINVF